MSSHYRLPNSSFVQTNDISDSGRCLFSSIGNALVEMPTESVFLFVGRRGPPRNLNKQISKFIVEVVKTPEVKEVMERLPGIWVREGNWKTPKEYIDIHLLNPTDRQAFGTTFDIHLLALYLEKMKVNTRLVVHTKYSEDNKYMWHHPINPNGRTVTDVCQMTSLDGQDLYPTDIVLINNGNTHWSRAKWNQV